MRVNHRLFVGVVVAMLAFAPAASADVVVFSNNFEDNDFAPEVGTWTFGSTSLQSVVRVTTPDSPNGTGIGLIDQSVPESGTLDATINLADTALLTGGNTVTIDFNLTARRTATNARTIFLDALDSNGAIVTRLVLGDRDAFGNGGSDRQRIGYDIDSTGDNNTENTVFDASTGTGATGGVSGGINNFWYGADNDLSNDYDVDARGSQVSLTIGESTFGIETQRAFSGPSYSTSGVANYNGGTFADIASFELSSAGTGFGIYLDNIEVNATATATAVPEPSSLSLFALGVLGLCGVRRRR